MEITILFGASGGIGSAIARRLTSKGDKLLLVGRNEQKLEILSAELDQPYIGADVLEPESIEHAIDFADKLLGSMDSGRRCTKKIVNCVGSVLLKPAHLTSSVEFIRTLQINLVSSFEMLRIGVPRMREGGGKFLFFSSAAAAVGLMNHEAIAAAKGGVEAMVRSAAATYAGKGIRINAIAPGLVETELTAKITGNSASRSYSERLHPVGRLGTVNDIASGAVWLLDEEQSWISGQILRIDGGLANLKG